MFSITCVYVVEDQGVADLAFAIGIHNPLDFGLLRSTGGVARVAGHQDVW